jgi:hypothetical protein
VSSSVDGVSPARSGLEPRCERSPRRQARIEEIEAGAWRPRKIQ